VSFIKVGAGTRTNGEEGRTFLLEEELAGEESVRARCARAAHCCSAAPVHQQPGSLLLVLV